MVLQASSYVYPSGFKFMKTSIDRRVAQSRREANIITIHSAFHIGLADLRIYVVLQIHGLVRNHLLFCELLVMTQL